MSQALNDLAAGMTAHLAELGVTFTVQGRAGTITGSLDSQAFQEELATGGTRARDVATLAFPSSSTYTPAVGDRITISGVIWIVNSRTRNPATWQLGLISDDE